MRQVQDIGTYWLLTATLADGSLVRARLRPEQAVPSAGDSVWLALLGAHILLLQRCGGAGRMSPTPSRLKAGELPPRGDSAAGAKGAT